MLLYVESLICNLCFSVATCQLLWSSLRVSLWLKSSYQVDFQVWLLSDRDRSPGWCSWLNQAGVCTSSTVRTKNKLFLCFSDCRTSYQELWKDAKLSEPPPLHPHTHICAPFSDSPANDLIIKRETAVSDVCLSFASWQETVLLLLKKTVKDSWKLWGK